MGTLYTVYSTSVHGIIIVSCPVFKHRAIFSRITTLLMPNCVDPTSQLPVSVTMITTLHISVCRFASCHQVREREEKLEEERVARGEAPKGVEAQWRPGVAYEGKQLASAHNFHKGVDVFAAPEKVTLSTLL